MSFEKNGFVVLRNVLEKQTTNLLYTEFKMIEKCKYFLNEIDENNKRYFEDSLVPFCSSFGGLYCFESLMVLIQPDLEKALSKKLFPTTSFSRILYAGAYMPKHQDRITDCEYGASMCIREDEDNPYPLFIEDLSGKEHAIHLKAGDLVFYKGILNHWREEYKGKEQLQVSMHYVDADGPYKESKFAMRPMLGLPKNLEFNPID